MGWRGGLAVLGLVYGSRTEKLLVGEGDCCWHFVPLLLFLCPAPLAGVGHLSPWEGSSLFPTWEDGWLGLGADWLLTLLAVPVPKELVWVGNSLPLPWAGWALVASPVALWCAWVKQR